MDIDKPLDEIIKSKPKVRRGGRGGGGGAGAAAAGGGGAGRGGSTSTRDRYAGAVPRGNNANAAGGGGRGGAGAGGAGLPDASKIIISNLPGDVTEAAVRDLMQSTVGPVKHIQMSYNAAGKSTGQATVLFRNKGDANKAHKAYHNRMIDNQRPMKVEIALDMSQLQSLESRVAPAPAANTRSGGAGARGGAKGGRGGAAAGAGRPKRLKPKTAEELDADMTAYKETGTA